MYLDKIWREALLNNLSDVKPFWKRNAAVKFVGVTTVIAKALQVHTQDRRQGDEFDTLKKKEIKRSRLMVDTIM